MALTTQLRVIIEGNAEGLISQLSKAGRESRNVFSEVSRSAKAEFAAATREADRAFKQIASLTSQANRADKGGQSGLANALRTQAAAKAVEADKFSAVAVAAEKRIQAESAKTVAAHAAEATGVSRLGGTYTQQGGAISRFFGAFTAGGGGARKSVDAVKEGVKSLGSGTGVLGGLTSAMGSLATKAGAAGTEVEGVASAAGAAKFGGVAAGVLGAAAGFGILAKTVEGGLKHFIEYAAEVRRVQNIVGGTAENASLLAGQFRHFNIDVDAGARALGIFGKNADINGGKKLEELGIHVARTKDGQVDLNRTLENAGDKFKSYGTGAEATSLALQAFGRGGAVLIPILKASREEIEAINRATSKQGLKFNDKDVKDAKELALSVRELHHSFEGLQVQVAKGLAPLFTEQTQGAANFLDTVNSVVQKVGGLGGVLKKISGEEGLAGLGKLGAKALPGIGQAVGFFEGFSKKTSQAAKDQAVLQQAISDTGEETTGFVADMLNAGYTLEQINRKIQQSGKSVEELKAGASIAPEFDTLAHSITITGNAAKFAGEQSDTLHAKLDLLGGGAISLAASQTALAAAQDGLGAALKSNGADFDNHTEKGRANRQAIEQDATAILANIQAMQKQGAAVGEVSAAWDAQVGALTATLRAAGLTDAQIQTLLRDYGLMPETKNTVVQAQTADAEAKLAKLIAQLRELQNTDVNINIAGGLNTGSVSVGGGVTRRSTGGPVRHDKRYDVGEKGAELFVPSKRSSLAQLVSHADKESRAGLVRLGIPGGIEPKAKRDGAPALLLGKQGPQQFKPPSDGFIVNARDTKRLRRTDDPGIIERILKRAGADKATLEALSAPGRFMGGRTEKGRKYQTGEKGAELFVPSQKTTAAHLATRADKESRGGLVRLGIPSGVQAKATRKGTPALLLGKHGPQLFTPPTDGVVVKASDTARLMRTNDEDIITRILKNAGLDKRSTDALSVAPGRARGGRVDQGVAYKTGEQGTEAFLPSVVFNAPRKATQSVTGPGVKRGSDGNYTITVGDTHLTVEGNTLGHDKSIDKAEVSRIVERKQAELVAELTAAMRG